MVNIEYANAYSEVLGILKCISTEEYNKIPKEKIKLFEECANKEYIFDYDSNKTLDEQNVSKRAKAVIAILFRDYWATDTQRDKIVAKQNYDRQKVEQELMEKYNPDNIFKKNETQQIYKTNEIKENNKLIPYKESIFKKIFSKMISFIGFKRN